MKKLSVVLLSGAICASAMAAEPTEWEKLCGNNGAIKQSGHDLPKPNYSNQTIKKVADKFSQIETIEYMARLEDDKFTENSGGDDYIKSMTFNPYSDMESTYGLCSGKKKYTGKCGPEQEAPQGVGINTHNMLTILCGEYRDNIQMLKKKLSWLSNASITPNQKQTYNKRKKVFDQLTGPGYEAMVHISHSLYEKRKAELGSKADSSLEVTQKSVEPMTICEYRYILSEYISRDKEVHSDEDFQAYTTGLASFMADSSNCSQSDKDHYYEFRGDGNFKAQTLESNGQLWYSRSFANACSKTRKVARGGYDGGITDEDCEKYFEAPFRTREGINHAALLKMFFYPDTAKGLDVDAIMKRYDGKDPKGLVMMTEDINGDGLGELIVLDPEVVDSCEHEEDFYGGKSYVDNTDESSDGACQILANREILNNVDQYDWNELGKAQKTLYTIVVAAAAEELSKNPAYEKVIQKAQVRARSIFGSNNNFTIGVKIITEVNPRWKSSYLRSKDRGFTRIFTDKNKAWDRMATVLDRHTDWYSIDTLHIKNAYYKPTFSPWIASSYYIFNSHSFVLPGYAMNMDLDPGRMHWMYVQKVKKNKWYNASMMDKQWPVSSSKFDLLNNWFDEVTFSRSGLGAEENGWDRFGGVSTSEMESILWLYQADRFTFHY